MRKERFAPEKTLLEPSKSTGLVDFSLAGYLIYSVAFLTSP